MRFEWGHVRGEVALPAAVLQNAKALARSQYAQAEAEEFCGDAVQDVVFPAWLAQRQQWLPLEELHALGFAPDNAGQETLLSTVGVDSHVDGINGPTFILVLHNDGLTFRQGSVSHKTKAGQWFVFDDAKPHQVRETVRSSCYVCWSVPLRVCAD